MPGPGARDLGQSTETHYREGWGIANAGSYVLSSELVRRDPGTLLPLGVVVARRGGRLVGGLNDLAWAGGRVWANIAPRLPLQN